MKLAAHFTLAEFTKSQWAERQGVANLPNAAEIGAMVLLCEKVLEPVRLHFARPVVVSSGFRSERVNKAVGGAPSSQHRKGEAVDIEIPGVSNYDLARWIWRELNYDQLILEYYTPGQPSSGWVHVSYCAARMRNQELTKVPGEVGYRPGLVT